jgi:glyoxylase-like metal-dependent hydrolase (beta-lactamase superfamily II)
LNTRLVNGRWVPTFPNARYLFARQEWEHWRVAEWRAAYTTDPYYEDSLLPVMESGQAELVATDYAFDDGVRIEPWPGHTPGHVCVVCSHGLYSPAQLVEQKRSALDDAVAIVAARWVSSASSPSRTISSPR